MNSQNRSKLQKKDQYYMYGHHVVLAALQNPKRKIIKIYCTDEIFKKYQPIIETYTYQVTNIGNLNTLVGADKTHQGFIAEVKSKFIDDLKYLDLNQIKRIAILDQISDPQNIGAIIRNAAAFEIEAIILPANNSCNENSTIAKIACGSLEKVEIVQVVNLKSAMDKLKANGFWILGLSSNAEAFIDEKIINGKIAFVLGAEDKGLRHLTEENCDYLMKFPIITESLNVASTSAIAFYLSYKNK